MRILLLTVLCFAPLRLCVSITYAQTHAQRHEVPLGLDLYIPTPEDNRLTPEKIALGKQLFFDPLLSRDKSLACSTCHDPQRAFTDGRPVAIGVFGRQGKRNVPTLINRAYGAAFFWDGRITTLETQVVQPIQDTNEMDLPLDDAVSRLSQNQDYQKQFQAAFGRDISADDLARALASFVRTIHSGDSPYDRYLFGDREALSAEARRGLELFRGKARCTACHVGPNLSDESFHNTGIAFRDGQWLDDGRFNVTANERDRGAFKTTTLRDIARTAPYMHDGSLPTLEALIDYYDRGGNHNPQFDVELRPLRLADDEKSALLAFLHALTSSN